MRYDDEDVLAFLNSADHAEHLREGDDSAPPPRERAALAAEGADGGDVERPAIEEEGRPSPAFEPPSIIVRSFAAPPTRTRSVPLAAQRVRDWIGRPPLAHVETGIPSLDRMTRGGLLAGKLTVFGGAPNAGKTTLAVQIALRSAIEGYAVAIHCIDEAADGILIRIGQFYGLSLRALEKRAPETLEALARYLDALPHLLIVDQDEDEMTIEDTMTVLEDSGHKMPNCRGLVLALDSLHTVHTRTSDKASTPRDRLDDVIATVKRFAKRSGALVIATSEIGRGAYRYRNAEQQIDPMAAFKESGAIEYNMNTGLVLVPVKGRDELVNVEVPKNKRGPREPFRLKLDTERCVFTEVDRPADVAKPARGADHGSVESESARLDAIKASILAYVQSENMQGRGAAGKKAIKARVSGNAELKSVAIDELETDGKLVLRYEKRGRRAAQPRYWRPEFAPQDPEAPAAPEPVPEPSNQLEEHERLQ